MLLLHANEVVSTDRLVDELWGESPPESAVNMLQGYVSHLRRTLEPDSRRGEHELLVSRPPGYVLQIRPGQLDAERFEQLGSEGRRLLEDGDVAASAERLRAALALWHGGALADLAYEAFARAEIDRLEELRLQTLEDRIDADLALGRHKKLMGELRQVVEQHPLRERLRAQLMMALYRCGQQAGALEVYREGRRALLDELGIEPGPTLRDLEQAILRQDPALGGTAAVPPAIVSRARRRRPLLVAGVALAGAAVAAAAVATLGNSGDVKSVAVKPHSVAVIDPKRNAVVADIPTGGYPGPLAADGTYIYVCNIGDATVSRIFAKRRKLFDTSSFARATDMIAGNRGELWSANGGSPGHTPFGVGPGTVAVWYPGPTVRAFRVGPSVLPDSEEQTTIAADSPGSASVWVGNRDSRTVRQLDRALGKTLLTIHGITPGGLAAVGDSSAGDTVWASDPARNLVARVDEHQKRIVRRIHVPKRPARLTADDDAVWVIARNQEPGAWRPTRETTPVLWRIDPNKNTVVARIALPLTPIRVTLGEGSVWVTAQRVLSPRGTSVDASVLRIDPATNRIVATIPLHTRAVDGIVVSHGSVWAAIPASQ